MKPKHKLPPWLARSKQRQDLVIGVVWYTATEWERTKLNSVDPEKFEETYDDWLMVVEKAIREFGASGLNVQKSFIISQALMAWCIAKGKENNAASRSEYVASQEYAAANTDA